MPQCRAETRQRQVKGQEIGLSTRQGNTNCLQASTLHKSKCLNTAIGKMAVDDSQCHLQHRMQNSNDLQQCTMYMCKSAAL